MYHPYRKEKPSHIKKKSNAEKNENDGNHHVESVILNNNANNNFGPHLTIGLQEHITELPVLSWEDVEEVTQYKLPTFPRDISLASNEDLARWAFMEVRARFKSLGVKSGNKVRWRDLDSLRRVELAAPVVCGIQEDIYKQTLLLNFTAAMEKGAGNCGEMSGAAAQMINNSGGYAAQYRVDNYGTHAFSLVGSPSENAIDHVDFSDYDGCWIVDPWAGIVCKASSYTVEFRFKMMIWALKEKYVYTHGEWAVADSDNWVNAVTLGSKHVNINPSQFAE